MDESIPTEELLVRYLDGDLSAEEKDRLESKLQSDEALRSQLERLQVSVSAVQLYGLHEQVRRIGREELATVKPVQGKVVPIRRSLRPLLSVAAVLILVLAGTLVFYTANLSGTKVYNHTFVEYTAGNYRSSETATTPLVQVYQQERYADVVQLSKASKLTEEESLLVGLAKLKTTDYTGAIQQFTGIAGSNSRYRQDAEFYLAMAYLKAEKYSEALSLLQAIRQNTNHLYHGQVSAKDVYDVKLLQFK